MLCSISEILSDLKSHTKSEVLELVQQRWDGIKELRGLVRDSVLRFQQNGGHELFLEKDQVLFNECLYKLEEINEYLSPLFKENAFKKRRIKLVLKRSTPLLLRKFLKGNWTPER